MTKDSSGVTVTSRDVRASERRQQILAVAKKLFAREGYHATSMRAINKEVGVAEALAYHYFPGGKLEILSTIVREGQQRRSEKFAGFVTMYRDDMTLREVLLLIAQQTIELFTDDREFLQIVMRERSQLTKEEWTALLRSDQTPSALMADFFAKRMARGEIRKMNVTLALAQFISPIILSTLFDTDPVAEARERFIEQLVDFTLRLWTS